MARNFRRRGSTPTSSSTCKSCVLLELETQSFTSSHEKKKDGPEKMVKNGLPAVRLQ